LLLQQQVADLKNLFSEAFAAWSFQLTLFFENKAVSDSFKLYNLLLKLIEDLSLVTVQHYEKLERHGDTSVLSTVE